MCSCFCETFCCCLLRFRDSCFRNTPSSSSNRNNSSEHPEPRHLSSLEDGREYPTLSETQRDYTREGQPAPRSPMPQLGRLSGQLSRPSGITASDVLDGRQVGETAESPRQTSVSLVHPLIKFVASLLSTFGRSKLPRPTTWSQIDI